MISSLESMWEDETWLHKPGPTLERDSSEQKQACLTPLVMRTTNFHISHDYQSNSFPVSKIYEKVGGRTKPSYVLADESLEWPC